MDRKCDFISHAGYGWEQKLCPQCSPDLSRPISEPKEITYLGATSDARRLRWQRMDGPYKVVELGKVYIGAMFDAAARVWRIGRVFWCEECMHFECQQEGLGIHHRDHSPAPITHFADDVLGTPYDAPAPAPGLRS